ncbi:metallophosphoesterase [Nonlabens marinus]|uniref:Surface antigen (D15) n=1 Tax=Nonlabens marinus S1-08 TaxID=1454201 RepID=W8VWK8_9FLAO|nr:metallophosphoesterase [Nonlabens marinus]BAO56428.1 surface antigen (D15) precursor [Nonlabens marinus S1-08]
MNKNNILLLIGFVILSGCASYNAQYKEGEEVDIPYPPNSDIEKSFYLIGDVGYSPIGGKSDGLLSLESYLKTARETSGDYLVFLGDNIYPTGMPAEGSEFRPIAENHLDAQIDVAEQFEGKTIFIPGNHDYYNENLVNVEREKKYIEDALEDKDIWEPKVGCAVESKEISDDIQLLIIDSQWYLAKWDEIPTVNSDCDQIKTRKEFFIEIESQFKKNQDKTIIVVMHHPLFTNGVHGGQYAAIKHLYPTQSNFPIPVLASLASLIRTSGGVSAQDRQNSRYQELADRMATLAVASKAERILFASGHEHTLQYIVNEGVRQIVSGSGSKSGYVTLSNDGLFSYGGNGFARMDVMKDGSSWVQFYGFEDGKHKLLYTKKAIEESKVYNVDSLPSDFPAFAKANIYTDDRTDKSDAFEGLWGKKYRDLYGIEINAKVAVLDTLKGGLKVMRAGGGHQTRSLRLQDSKGKEYNLRALKKSAVQFLQTTVFKDQSVEEGFKGSAAEDLLYDFYTAAHPYGALAVPELSESLGIYHTNPEIYYVPKQKALGNYNFDYGDELYMLVERPEDNFKDLQSFGKPDDIHSTADVFEKLAQDEKYKIDQDSYVRARMFDMLLGDWDRHQDQWRWSEFELDNGNHIFKPIPRDRDQVFSNFDGAVFATLRTLIGITKQFATYNDNLDNVKWFNTAATYLDRSLAKEADREVWLEQARFIQNNLTDAEIEAAFRNLPAEIYVNPTTQDIINSMKDRRANLVDIAERYYKVLSRLAIVTGTDKDDIIDIERIEKGKTRVTVYRNKGGERADVVLDRIYDKTDTKEIWIYALDDEDIIHATDKAGNPIKVRVIGGQDNDIYDLEEGRAITLFDHQSKENTFTSIADATKRTTDAYGINLYDPRKNIKAYNVLTPAIGFNPDDGIRLGLQNVYTVDGFNRNPHTRVHKFTAGYYFATQGYLIEYQGEFAGIFRNANLLFYGKYTGPTFTENFFGLGNDTANNDDVVDFDFNRVRLSTYAVGAGTVYRGEYGSNLKLTATVRGIEVEDSQDRFIADYAATLSDPEFFDRKWYGDLNATYNYSSFDNPLNPTRGMIFEFDNGIIGNLQEFEDIFYYLKPKLGFHNAVTKNRKLVLRTLAQAHVILGDDFEFYQSAQLGQNTGLRGYRTQRFSGESSFAGTADLRYSFKEFKSGFLPLQIGIFAGGDVGRVWLDGEESKQWHNDYGGGFWINSADAIGATFNLFNGEDGLRFSFQVGFSF